MSGASITRGLSVAMDTRLNFYISITLLRYPNARFSVVYQLSCLGFHPCSPPGRSTLLMFIHRVLSSSVYVVFAVGKLLSQCTYFVPVFLAAGVVD